MSNQLKRQEKCASPVQRTSFLGVVWISMIAGTFVSCSYRIHPLTMGFLEGQPVSHDQGHTQMLCALVLWKKQWFLSASVGRFTMFRVTRACLRALRIWKNAGFLSKARSEVQTVVA